MSFTILEAESFSSSIVLYFLDLGLSGRSLLSHLFLLIFSPELHSNGVVVLDGRNHTLQELEKNEEVLFHTGDLAIFHQCLQYLPGGELQTERELDRATPGTDREVESRELDKYIAMCRVD